jgi:GT2 family glycosyltransferase
LNSNSSHALNPTADRIDDAPQVSVVIVNWNGARVLDRCLTAVFHQTFTRYEVVVIDNASTDGSAVELENKFPPQSLRLERLSRNLGFAAANNLGARLARGKWLALLNNDAFPSPDWLECLLTAAENHPDYGFFASRLIQAENQTLLDGTGDIYHVSGMAWRRHYNMSVTQTGVEQEEVFSPCAAAALYRRELFLSIGGFDEDYFNYHEDIDLGFRLRLQDSRCLYVPQAVVYHIGSASQGSKSDYVIYYGHRNLVWVFMKNMPGLLFWRHLPAHVMANLLMIVYYSANGHARAIWRAKIDALRGFPAVLRKRREVQQARRVTPSEITRVMDHGWFSPYVRRR